MNASFSALMLAVVVGQAASRQMERLDRGMIALHHRPGEVFVSWRLLSADPHTIAFHLYRATGEGERNAADYGCSANNSTTVLTQLRLPTLMHDPIYRLSVAWQNVGYNQPTQVGFFLGDE